MAAKVPAAAPRAIRASPSASDSAFSSARRARASQAPPRRPLSGGVGLSGPSICGVGCASPRPYTAGADAAFSRSATVRSAFRYTSFFASGINARSSCGVAPQSPYHVAKQRFLPVTGKSFGPLT